MLKAYMTYLTFARKSMKPLISTVIRISIKKIEQIQKIILKKNQ